jgi:hypothetical protein
MHEGGDLVSDVSIPMTLPLDTAGFLRRECPNCNKQFKWYSSEEADTAGDELIVTVGSSEAYYCPYCHTPAPSNAWWTQEQIEYARELAAAEVMRPMLGNFGADLEQLNRPGSLISFNVQVPDMPRPDPLTEPDDMVRVDLPCHPEEPLKVDETWTSDVACLVCGIRYPMELYASFPKGLMGSSRDAPPQPRRPPPV